MHWIDDGLVLSAQKYGESSLILHALTREHGRFAGLVRGGTGKRLRGILQPGN
ncbi:MAG: recombination protein O N-terminal domain-containing protein, partial [Sneathiella sp.]|nr:recombination protein O N-terminal domain-containing protein [Sneathiella sp.]